MRERELLTAYGNLGDASEVRRAGRKRMRASSFLFDVVI
jgi:hypothetical protein